MSILNYISLKSNLKFLIKKPHYLVIALLIRLPFFKFLRIYPEQYQNKLNFKFWFNQKVLGRGENKKVYWPVHPTSQITDSEKIYAGVDTCPGFMRGCYIQGKGGIYIGDYTQIAPNVVIVSANHNIIDTRQHIEKPVFIGNYSWIGAGAKILPGVVLGPHTIVGAGAVVTKNFKEGHCLIAGNPAKLIREYDKEVFVKYHYEHEYLGYLTKEKFLLFIESNQKIKELMELAKSVF